MRSPAPYVSCGGHDVAGHLTLHGEVPGPGLRIFEGLALCGYRERELVGAGASGVVHIAKADVGGGLERRIAAQKNGIADAELGVEASPAGSDHRLGRDLIGDAEARLELVPLNVRILFGSTPEKILVLRIGGF